jgi:hypothetical protein
VLTLLVVALVTATCLAGFAFADPCSAQLGYPIIPAVYANTVVTVIVPVSATCSISYGTQLYATATAYDLNSNTLVGSANTILTSVNGGYAFTGQLGFNVPATTQSHWVQVTVTFYNNQSGNPITSAGEAFPINTGTVQVVTTTVTQPTTSQFAPSEQRPRFIFAYVAIAAILATVVIVTVGLIVYSRRPVSYYPTQTGY